jgi:hypothetical protein
MFTGPWLAGKTNRPSGGLFGEERAMRLKWWEWRDESEEMRVKRWEWRYESEEIRMKRWEWRDKNEEVKVGFRNENTGSSKYHYYSAIGLTPESDRPPADPTPYALPCSTSVQTRCKQVAIHAGIKVPRSVNNSQYLKVLDLDSIAIVLF